MLTPGLKEVGGVLLAEMTGFPELEAMSSSSGDGISNPS